MTASPRWISPKKENIRRLLNSFAAARKHDLSAATFLAIEGADPCLARFLPFDLTANFITARLYSSRKTCIGSTRAARTAGSREAAAETPSTRATTAASVVASEIETP